MDALGPRPGCDRGWIRRNSRRRSSDQAIRPSATRSPISTEGRPSSSVSRSQISRPQAQAKSRDGRGRSRLAARTCAEHRVDVVRRVRSRASWPRAVPPPDDRISGAQTAPRPVRRVEDPAAPGVVSPAPTMLQDPRGSRIRPPRWRRRGTASWSKSRPIVDVAGQLDGRGGQPGRVEGLGSVGVAEEVADQVALGPARASSRRARRARSRSDLDRPGRRSRPGSPRRSASRTRPIAAAARADPVA